jgi:hypothetical protein
MLILLGAILIALGLGCILSEALKEKKTEKTDDKKETPKQ